MINIYYVLFETNGIIVDDLMKKNELLMMVSSLLNTFTIIIYTKVLILDLITYY